MLQLIAPNGKVLRTDIVEGRSVQIGNATVMPAFDGWTGLGGHRLATYTPPPPSLEEQKAHKLRELTLYADRARNGGTAFNGLSIETTPDARTTIIGAIMDLQVRTNQGEANPTIRPNFGSERVSVDLETAQMIGQAIRQHIEDVGAHQELLENAISTATDTKTLAAIDIQSGWPTTP